MKCERKINDYWIYAPSELCLALDELISIYKLGTGDCIMALQALNYIRTFILPKNPTFHILVATLDKALAEAIRGGGCVSYTTF